MMAETFVIYYGLAFLCWILAYLDVKQENKISVWTILLITLYALIAGFKYSVGSDFQSYLQHYQRVYDGVEFTMYFEEGYLMFNRFMAMLNVPPVFFFVTLNAINIIAVVILTKRTIPTALPWTVLIFIMMDYGFSLSTNIYRQYLAFSCFSLILPFCLTKHKFKWIFVLLTLLSVQIHKSVVVGIVYLLLVDKNLITRRNRFIAIIVLALLHMFGVFIMPFLMSIFSFISDLIGYENSSYLNGGFQVKVGGLGIFLKFIITSFAVWFYPEIKTLYSTNRLLTLCFNGYFIGYLIKTFILNDIVLTRVLIPFTAFEYLTVGWTMWYLLIVKRNMLFVTFILVSYMVLFAAYIIDSINWMSPYIPFPTYYG